MSVNIQDELYLILKTVGFDDDNISLLTMHFSEIEQEAEDILDLFTVLRSHAYRSDSEATQEALAELSITLEHSLHHIRESLPLIQQQLDIAP